MLHHASFSGIITFGEPVAEQLVFSMCIVFFLPSFNSLDVSCSVRAKDYEGLWPQLPLAAEKELFSHNCLGFFLFVIGAF